MRSGPCILTHAETRRRNVEWNTRLVTLAAEKLLEDARELLAKVQEKASKASAAAAAAEKVAGLSAQEKKTDPTLLQKAKAAKEAKKKIAQKKKEAHVLVAANAY